MKISFAVTAFKETSRSGPTILDCIDAAVNHPQIDEIVVVDDYSNDYAKLVNLLEGIPKVKVFRNESNLGVFGNKLSAVANSTGDWVMNSDSDNVFDSKAIDTVLDRNFDVMTWYCPSFAKPKFDYRDFVGIHDINNIGEAVRRGGMFPCLVNTGNQTVNRIEYLRVFEKYLNKRADLMMPNYLELDEKKREGIYWRQVFDACDSFIFNLEWIKDGGKLEVVKDFEYDHYYTSGLDSNYNRAPQEKGKLNDVLLSLLQSPNLREGI